MRAFLLLTLLAPSAFGQVSIQATINKTDASLDDQLVLAVTVSGEAASLPDPEIPALPNFSVYSSGRNQSISFVNGRVSSSIVHTYVLVPRAPGKAVLGPITITAGGRTVRAEPIEIVVRKPGDPAAGSPSGGHAAGPKAAQRPPPAAAPGEEGPAGDDPLFVTAKLDQTRAYVDQQVTLTVRFHTAINLLGSPQYMPPALTGFLTEDLPPERHGTVSIRGRPYYYSEIRTALFPAQAGRLTIGRAVVRVQFQRETAIDPFASDFFERFFSGGLAPQTRELRTEPLTLEVLPLPDGKPAGFSGAVGRYAAKAELDRQRVKAGEAVTLSITVTGAGNLKGLGSPELPPLPGLKAYDTVSALNLDKSGDVVHGSKSFKTVLVPRASGDLAIPPARFSYFDPEAKAYKTAQTEPLTLKADPADPNAAPAAFGPSAAPSAPGVTTVASDIRYLKLSPRRPLVARALAAFAGSGLVHTVPFAAFAAGLCLAWRRRRREADPAGARARAARERALARLSAGNDGAALSDALAGYLADKLDSPAAGLTARRAAELLRRRWPKLSEARLRETQDLWRAVEGLRFAPGGAAEADLRACAESLRALIGALEEELR